MDSVIRFTGLEVDKEWITTVLTLAKILPMPTNFPQTCESVLRYKITNDAIQQFKIDMDNWIRHSADSKVYYYSNQGYDKNNFTNYTILIILFQDKSDAFRFKLTMPASA